MSRLPAPLLGDADGQKDVLLRLLPAAGRVDPSVPDQPQTPVHAVEKQPHVLDDKGPPPRRGRGLQGGQPPLDVLFGLGHVQMVVRDIPDGAQALLFVLQPQEAPGMALGQPLGCEDRRSRSLLATAEGERPSWAAASSCVTPDCLR